MVRINLVNPKNLADQHLVAEYNEILMLLGYVRKHPELGKIPEKYTLGKGHILFFKNKLKYLKQRHERIKKEMARRGFKARETINLKEFDKKLINGWRASTDDKNIIKKRLRVKLKLKPGYYRYYRKRRSINFFVDMLK